MSQTSVRFLSEPDTGRLLSWGEVILCIAAAYKALGRPDNAPPRVLARGDGVWLRALAAVSPTGKSMGAKVFGKSRSKQASYLIALWDQQTAELTALLDAQHITAMRTAATSAVAVDRLCPQQIVDLAVLGSSAEAEGHVNAIASVRGIRSLKVFSPTPASREKFAAKFSSVLEIQCSAAASAQAAIAGANIVVAAARSRDETPILQGAWLEAGMTVVSIGSTIPEQREVDPEVIRRADCIVADVPEEVMHETGDFIAAREAGVDFKGKVVSLADLVQQRVAGRQGADQILLYKSVGSSLQDIAVAELCVEKAQQQNVGTPLPFGLSLKHGPK